MVLKYIVVAVILFFVLTNWEIEQNEFKTSKPLYKNKTLTAQIIDVPISYNSPAFGHEKDFPPHFIKTEAILKIRNNDAQFGGEFKIVLRFTPKPLPIIGDLIDIADTGAKYIPLFEIVSKGLNIIPHITEEIGYTDGEKLVIIKKVSLQPNEEREERIIIRENDGVAQCCENIIYVPSRGFYAIRNWNKLGYKLDGYSIVEPTVSVITGYKITIFEYFKECGKRLLGILI